MNTSIDVRTSRLRTTAAHAGSASASGAARSNGLGGNSIGSIVSTHCAEVPVLAGVLVESLDTQVGTWQYTLDAGRSWRVIRTDLINRDGRRGLVSSLDARLRVLPFGGQRGSARVAFHPVQFFQEDCNGIYRAYAPAEERPHLPSVSLVLGLSAINGAPASVHVPRPRNKRALAAARHSTL